MIRIGVTGTLGAGKSTLARLFERWGATRIDADELAREAVRPGSTALERIRERWGAAVVRDDGSLDRGALRRIVFRDPSARRQLETIVHPEVGRLRDAHLAEAEAAGVEVVVEEVPLLFEVGLMGAFDVIVVVDAPEEIRHRRVVGDRGLSADEFDAMEAAQMAPDEKRRRADHLIENAGTRADLEAAARTVWERIVGAPPVERTPGGAGHGGAPPWAVDLHLHTDASPDCLSRPGAVVEAARQAGLDRIAVTDHDRIEGAFAAHDLAPDLVIVGEEVRTAEGLDLIGLFIAERIEPGAPFGDVADEIHRQGGVVYLPHPFDSWRGGEAAFFDAFAARIDLVEGFNARVHDSERNRRAVRWAESHGIPVGAGSDAHLLSEIGRGRLRVAPFEGPESFLAAAREGRIEGETSPGWVHLGSTWAKFRSWLPV